MSLQIADYGRGLPDGFYENLHNVFDEPPDGSQVGYTIKDYSRMLAVRLVRFGEITVSENMGMGLVFDTNRKIYRAIPRSGGKSGSASLELAVHQTEEATKDQFARGSALITVGDLAPRTLYIEGNTATGERVDVDGSPNTAGGERRLTIHFETPLPDKIDATDVVILRSHKYMNVTVGSNDNKIPVGASLARSPVSEKYAWMQWGGEGGLRGSTAIGTSAQDGTPLIQAAAGEVQLQSASDPKPVIAAIQAEGADIAADEIIPVEFLMGFEF